MDITSGTRRLAQGHSSLTMRSTHLRSLKICQLRLFSFVMFQRLARLCRKFRSSPRSRLRRRGRFRCARWPGCPAHGTFPIDRGRATCGDGNSSAWSGRAAWPLAAKAQQAADAADRLHSGTNNPASTNMVAFRKGLDEAGFKVGLNVAMVPRVIDPTRLRNPSPT